MKLQIVFLILILTITPVFAIDKLTGFVNDEAMIISPQYKFLIEQELGALMKNTSVQMAVAAVNTTGGTPIEEYSLSLAHNVLGEKGKDNGVLILLAVNDRAYRIEVGYGLEPVLNAALLGRIGRSVMEPQFKAGNYEEGLLEGIRAISAILRNDTSYETQIESKDVRSVAISFIVMTLIKFLPLIIFIIIFISVMTITLGEEKKGKKKKNKKDDNWKDFAAAWIIADMFSRGGRGRGGSGGFGGGGFGGFGGGSFGGGGFSGKF